MAIWDIFKKKDNRNNFTFGEEERELSLSRRRLKSELEKQRFELEKLRLEQQKLEIENQVDELKGKLGYFDEDEDEEKEDGSPLDKMITAFIASIIAKNQKPTAITPNVDNSQPAAVDFSEEELTNMWKETPKQYRKMAKNLSDEQIKGFIKSKYSNISDKSLDIAIRIIRND